MNSTFILFHKHSKQALAKAQPVVNISSDDIGLLNMLLTQHVEARTKTRFMPMSAKINFRVVVLAGYENVYSLVESWK